MAGIIWDPFTRLDASYELEQIFRSVIVRFCLPGVENYPRKSFYADECFDAESERWKSK